MLGAAWPATALLVVLSLALSYILGIAIGTLQSKLRRRADAGVGPGKSGAIQVTGGALGVVIDARGRPLQFPGDPVRRRELMKRWSYAVGG